jgi:hypothetical protein
MDNDIDRSEVQAALDQLDELILKAKAVPLTDQIRIERLQILNALDRLRAALALAPDDQHG